MTAVDDERLMISERIAPGMLPRVLNSVDMTVIFIAIVLFAVQASVIQPAGPTAYTYWLLGFVAFLIPGAFVTAQLGHMFPQEGSLYVWTQKALGPFWGFFAGFCAWWPGVIVMVTTADLVVLFYQFIDQGALPKPWQQMIVILAVLWASAFLSTLRLRITQTYANIVVFVYGGAIFLIGLAGVIWLTGGGHSANSFSGVHNWIPDSANWTFFGLVILALLGVEVPLNMGVEIKERRAITRYLLWGGAAVMVAYVWMTFGNMVAVPLKDNNATTGIVSAVQNGFWGAHWFASIIAAVMMWFFFSNTVVYNYSFSRLLFVSGLERRMPAAMGRVSKRTKVPVTAILVQTVLSSIIAIAVFGPWASGSHFPTQVFLILQAALTVIWCVSMVLLFTDIFLVKRAFPQKFEEVRVAHPYVLYASGIVGVAASVLGAIVVFKSPFDPSIFSTNHWRLWLAVMTLVSAAAAVVIYVVSELVHKREAPTPTVTPAG